MFRMTKEILRPDALRDRILSQSVGAVVCFEGRVRDHNHGESVTALEYDAYIELAEKEGLRVLDEAKAKWDVTALAAEHRFGLLDLSDVAVCVVALSSHRREAFEACRYVIDELKSRLPIWKKEYYRDRAAQWVGCARCDENHAHHRAQL